MMLNEYAEAVRTRLVAIFPEFAGHVGEEDGHLVIRYPSTEPDYPLYVWTYDDEITVGFDMWHMHIPCMDDDVDAEVAEAAELIRTILEGRTLVVVKHAGDEWIGSHLATSSDEVSLERGEAATVRGWSGLVASLGPAEAPSAAAPRLRQVYGLWTGLAEIRRGRDPEALPADCVRAVVRLFAMAHTLNDFVSQARMFFVVFGAELVEVAEVEPYDDLLAREEPRQEDAEAALEATEKKTVCAGVFHFFTSSNES